MFNDHFYDYVFNVWGRDVYLNLGSAGSSKSVHSQMKNAFRMMFRGENVLAVRETYASMKDSVFSEMKQAVSRLGLDEFFRFTVSPLCVECTPTKRMMIFRGLDKVDKIKSIVPKVGIINHVDIEEATEVEESDLNQLQFRSRGGGERLDVDTLKQIKEMVMKAENEKRLIDIRHDLLKMFGLDDETMKRESKKGEPKSVELRFNTISEDHWIPQRFIFTGKNGKPVFELPHNDDMSSVYDTKELYILHSTHWHNQFLTVDDHYKYESYRFIDQYYYDVYARGLWGILGDTIFTKFKLARFDQKFIESIPVIRVGQDYGSTDPTTIVRVGIDKAKKHIYIISEAGDSGMDESQIYAMNRSFLWHEDEMIGADPAGVLTITGLKNYGLKFRHVTKPAGYKLQFIRILKQYTIYVSEDCPKFLREIRGYTWPTDKNGKRLEEAPDGNDHYIDAGLFYALNDQLIGFTKSKIYG
jgi:phage terminase large subunit